jgi:hypothetical protein
MSNTISGGVSYTATGRSIAQAGLSAYGGKTWPVAREVMKDSFESVAQSPSTSPTEKAIADLGIRVGSHSMQNNDAASARYAVLQTISQAVGGSIGAVLAHACNSAWADKQWPAARAITKDGLDVIQTYSPESSDQALAALGNKFGSHAMQDSDAASARRTVLKRIENGDNSNVAQALAQTTVAAYGEKQWNAAREITKDGLEAIRSNAQSTPEQKALAQLGVTFGSHSMTDTDAAKSRLTVLKELSNPLSSSLTDEICNVSISAYGEKQWPSARAIMKDGFEAVLANPNATAQERELAQLGINVGAHSMSDTEAAQARLKVMKQLRDV